MIDCAHDFGCMGPNGKGTWEMQGLKDLSNVLLMGGGSKCLSTNLGNIVKDMFGETRILVAQRFYWMREP